MDSPVRETNNAPAPPPGGIAHDLFCQTCGYNLRALVSDRCPECGDSLDTVRTREPQIPWVYRHQLGRFRAYWQTVRMVMFNQRRFCEEMARPVNFAESQRFRWVTVLHVYVPLVLGTAFLLFVDSSGAFGPRRPQFTSDLPMEIQAGIAALVAVALFLFLAAATGVPSYFFHPKVAPVPLQNRAIALSYYAAGPMAVTAVPVFAAAVAAPFSPDSKLRMGLMLFAVLFFFIAQVGAWWADLIHLSRRLMPQCPGRRLVVALCVPSLWLLTGGLIFAGIPLAGFIGWVVVASLQGAPS